MTYHVEAETFRGAVVSRVYFEGQPETSHVVEGQMSVRRVSRDVEQSCVTHTVYIKVALSPFQCPCTTTGLLWTHAQRASMLYFADVFLYIFFIPALVGQTAERIFTKLSHVVDIRHHL